MSLCSGQMLQHNSSLGEASLERPKVSRFPVLLVKMLPGSAQVGKQGRVGVSSDQLTAVMAQTPHPPLTNNRRFCKAAHLFFALINLIFYKYFHTKALKKKWLRQFNLFPPPVCFDAQAMEECRLIYQVCASCWKNIWEWLPSWVQQAEICSGVQLTRASVEWNSFQRLASCIRYGCCSRVYRFMILDRLTALKHGFCWPSKTRKAAKKSWVLFFLFSFLNNCCSWTLHSVVQPDVPFRALSPSSRWVFFQLLDVEHLAEFAHRLKQH